MATMKKSTGRSADASAGAAAAASVKKAKARRSVGTADSKARRSATRGMDAWGIPSSNTGTSPDYQYHVTGSRSTRPNGGKRISEKRTEKGYTQLHYSDGFSEYVADGRKFNTSDAIVKPTIKKKAAAKKTARPLPKR